MQNGHRLSDLSGSGIESLARSFQDSGLAPGSGLGHALSSSPVSAQVLTPRFVSKVADLDLTRPCLVFVLCLGLKQPGFALVWWPRGQGG